MEYMTDGLTFNTLRSANVKRLTTDKYSECESSWTLAHWLQATVGEIGELANLLKKIDRGDFTLEDVKGEVEKELADIQTYLDILAFKAGVDLGRVTIAKFNEISTRVGSDVYIWADGSGYYLKGEVL